ncbi:ankyrin repeat-containing domain protein [Lophiotrema nucula]|uniref:Ankyrin repeat-containing domain protein n=1 Tax=Lophiotrema nucula TaxID=690887 RepID=A0A6A5YHY0_9PLEO|nr:ankyrin repeat-containing domain protein [Lophiotrema nucula]
MPKARKNDAELENHRDEIRRLYIDRNMTLAEVAEEMANKHRIYRTKAQFERVITKTWGFKKNGTSQEWKYIAIRTRERKAIGRDSAIFLNEQRIPHENLERQLRRYGYQNTFEQLNPAPCPRTPPNVFIRTPSPSPSSETVQAIVVATSPAQVKLATLAELTAWTAGTPWRQVKPCIDELLVRGPATLIHLPDPVYESFSAQLFDDEDEEIEIPWTIRRTKAQEWIQDFNLAQLHGIHGRSDAPGRRIYLPNGGTLDDINTEALLDLSQRSTQLELLKLAVKALSNNSLIETLAPAILELSQHPRNRPFLTELLKGQQASFRAFAEKLLPYAADAGDLQLATILLDSGVNIDAKARFENDLKPESALQRAVLQSNSEMIKLLFMQGARLHNGRFRCSKHYTHNTILEVLVCCGDLDLVDTVLPTQQSTIKFAPHRECILSLASEQKDPAILNYLLLRIPSLQDTFVKLRWWLLTIAADCHGSIPMIDFILQKYPESTQHLSSTCQIAMIASCRVGKSSLVRKFMDLGANGNDIAIIPGKVPYKSLAFDFRYLERSTALYVSVVRKRVDVVRLLLAANADANISCHGISPLQIAVVKGNTKLLEMLLESNADPNHVPSKLIDVSALESDLLMRGDPNPPIPIRLALQGGNLQIYHSLLQAGATYSSTVCSWDPIESACEGRNRELVEITIKNSEGRRLSPRSIAACIRHMGCDFVQDLHDRGVLQLTSDTISLDVLCAAIMVGKNEFVGQILGRLPGQLPSDWGTAALATAAFVNNMEMVQLFLLGGIKPYWRLDESIGITDIMGSSEYEPHLQHFMKAKTPMSALLSQLEWQVTTQRVQQMQSTLNILELFLDVCLEVPGNQLDEALRNQALDLAFYTGLRKGLLSLVRSMVDRNLRKVQDCFQYSKAERISPLQLAVGGSHYELARYLIEKGAEVNHPVNFYYDTALQEATRHDHPGLVRELLARGADVNAATRFRSGATALQFAAMNGNFELVQLLLQAGAILNAPRAAYHGRTALEGAAEHGGLDMVAFLLRAGENCQDVRGKENMNYRRAVYRAWKEGHMVVVDVMQEFKLEKYGPDDVEDVETIVDSMVPGELFYDIRTPQDWSGFLRVVETYREPSKIRFSGRLTSYVLNRTNEEMRRWGLEESNDREKILTQTRLRHTPSNSIQLLLSRRNINRRSPNLLFPKRRTSRGGHPTTRRHITPHTPSIPSNLILMKKRILKSD